MYYNTCDKSTAVKTDALIMYSAFYRVYTGWYWSEHAVSGAAKWKENWSNDARTLGTVIVMNILEWKAWMGSANHSVID